VSLPVIFLELEYQELGHKSLCLLLSGNVIDLIDDLIIDAYDLGIMFVLVLPKGLNDNLLALDVDAHAVVGY
jgi:hypothetical protein